MQFIVTNDLGFIVFTSIAILLLAVATWFLFISRRARERRSGYFWIFTPSRGIPTFIAFAMMFIGMALIAGWYFVQTPVFDTYTLNVLAVTAIAAVMGVVAAFGIALIGLYSKGVG